MEIRRDGYCLAAALAALCAVLVGCDKPKEEVAKEEPPEVPVRVVVGDCAGPTARFESGPRPVPFKLEEVEERMAVLLERLEGNGASLAELRTEFEERRRVRVAARAARARGDQGGTGDGAAGAAAVAEEGRGAAVALAPAGAETVPLDGPGYASMTATLRAASGTAPDREALVATGGPEVSPSYPVGGMMGPPGRAEGPRGAGAGMEPGRMGLARSAGIAAASAVAEHRESEAQVYIGTGQIDGQLDRDIVRRVLRAKLVDIRECYDTALAKQPTLAGTVKTKFMVSGKGAVLDVSASGMDEAVTGCVAKVIEGTSFPAPRDKGLAQVRYPLELVPPGKAPKPGTLDAQERADERALERAEAKAEEEAAGAGAVVSSVGIVNPLTEHTEALGRCFAKGERGYGALLLELSRSEDGTMGAAKSLGLIDEATAACVTGVARRAKVTWSGVLRTVRCPIAFGQMPSGEARTIDIGAEISVASEDLIEAAEVARRGEQTDKVDELVELLELQERMDELSLGQQPVAITGPHVIRPVDETLMKVVTRVLRTLSEVGGENWVLATEDEGSEDGWRYLDRELAMPVAPVPIETGRAWWKQYAAPSVPRVWPSGDPAPKRLSILVREQGIWVGESGGESGAEGAAEEAGEGWDMGKIDDAYDWDALAKVLAERKQTPAFAERVDIQIGGDDRVPYGMVVRVIDAANEAGFTDWYILPPTWLAARPTE